MTKYYALEPEVAGGFGPHSVLNPKVRPLDVNRFHYEFDVWLGDPLLEAVGCFIVTEPLRQMIAEMHATGMSFGDVEISKSPQFDDLYPNRPLPDFVWLKVLGKAGRDDFGLSPNHGLVVSERILNLLKGEGMSHSEITAFDAGT
jgi:hypothetical protein